MCDDDEGFIEFLGEEKQKRMDLLGVHGIEVAGGLVCENESGIVAERSC
jgi:hypothetical protein